MDRSRRAVGPDRRAHRLATILIALTASVAIAGAAPRAGAAPPPTPTLARPTEVRTLRGVTFGLTPYTFAAWPNALGFFAPTLGTVPLHPTGPVATTLRDSTGVRVVIHNGKTYNMPVAQAQDGMHWLARYGSDGTPAALTLAMREGRRLIATHRTSRATGSAWWFPYLFPFNEYGQARYLDRPPWYSGMSQGEAVDLFSQLYVVTKSAMWKQAAQHAFASFLYPLRPGQPATSRPWVDHVVGRSLWIEEYPLPNPNDHTINGFGFALLGLTDYARTFHDSQAQLIAEGGLATWLHAIPKVRHPGGVMGYSLSHPTDRSTGYHRTVTAQLKFLGGVTGNPDFAALASVLYDDFH